MYSCFTYLCMYAYIRIKVLSTAVTTKTIPIALHINSLELVVIDTKPADGWMLKYIHEELADR